MDIKHISRKTSRTKQGIYQLFVTLIDNSEYHRPVYCIQWFDRVSDSIFQSYWTYACQAYAFSGTLFVMFLIRQLPTFLLTSYYFVIFLAFKKFFLAHFYSDLRYSKRMQLQRSMRSVSWNLCRTAAPNDGLKHIRYIQTRLSPATWVFQIL